LASAATFHRRTDVFLAAKMQPDVAAHAFAQVEDEWSAQVSLFLECNSTASDSDTLVDCHAAPKAFEKACGSVVNAVLQGSGGERDSVHEYLKDVCGQNVLDSWHAGQCFSFAKGIDGIMTGSVYENRMSLRIGDFCTKHWSQFLETEKSRRQQEEEASGAAEAKRVEAEKAKAIAEEEKQKADDAAKAAKEAEDEKAQLAMQAAKEAEDNATEHQTSVVAAADQEEQKAKAESDDAKVKIEESGKNETVSLENATVVEVNSTVAK